MRTHIPAILLLLALPGSLHGQTFPLSPQQEETLETTGELTIYFDGTPERILYHGPLSPLIRTDLEDLSPTIGVESLFRLPMPSSLREGSDPILDLYNILHRVSTMKGIQYYSASRGRMRTMFHDAYRIASPEAREPVPDLTFTELPHEPVSITIFQDDSSFGKNLYRITYRVEGSFILLSMENLDTLAYMGLIPLVSPGGLRTHLVIVPRGEELMFYGICGVRTIRFFGMEKRYASFYNRIVALKNWFQSQLPLRP
ncbi:DUF6675 family protein [Spirochaeta thermophila]|nr:DUF6675 family protein [Spirochaeta thermophila]